MKLVLTYTAGDDYTYAVTTFCPFEFSSKEDAEIELLMLHEQAIKEHKHTMIFQGHELYVGHFHYYDERTKQLVYVEPLIQTLEDWFEYNSNTDHSPVNGVI